MKKIVLSSILAFFFLTSHAQFHIGIKAGVHSYDYGKITNLNLNNNGLQISLDPSSSEYGAQFGLYGSLKLLGLGVEGSLMLNSSSISYRLTGENVLNELRKESFVNLDIPVLLNIRFFRLVMFKVGPVAHKTLSSTSELLDIDGYAQNVDELRYGYILGAGVNIWKFGIELLFEGNLSKFGDHIQIGDTNFAFDNNANRLLLNLLIRL